MYIFLAVNNRTEYSETDTFIWLLTESVYIFKVDHFEATMYQTNKIYGFLLWEVRDNNQTSQDRRHVGIRSTLGVNHTIRNMQIWCRLGQKDFTWRRW